MIRPKIVSMHLSELESGNEIRISLTGGSGNTTEFIFDCDRDEVRRRKLLYICKEKYKLMFVLISRLEN